MKKPKRYDKHYTLYENRLIRELKGQGWSNREIAEELNRTEIGISRHWSQINKTKFKKRQNFTTKDHYLIIDTMRDVCAKMGFKKPFVNIYDDTRIGNGYGFKVLNGNTYPDRVWMQCLKAVQKLGYNCTLSHSTNYYENTQAHSRGLRIRI